MAATALRPLHDALPEAVFGLVASTLLHQYAAKFIPANRPELRIRLHRQAAPERLLGFLQTPELITG